MALLPYGGQGVGVGGELGRADVGGVGGTQGVGRAVTVGVGSGVWVATAVGNGVGVGVASGVGAGVGVGHPLGYVPPLSPTLQSVSDPPGSVKPLGRDSVLTNGAAMSCPSSVP